MLRVLIIGLSGDKGGIETLFYNLYNNIDRKKIKIDFLSFYESCAYEEQFKKGGANVFHLSSRGKDPFGYRKKIDKFFKIHKDYDYVWINQSSASNISAQKTLKKFSQAKVITHSHGTYFENSNYLKRIINNFLHNLNQNTLNKITDYKFACSIAAGKWLFGDNQMNDTIVIRNAIDTTKFEFSDEIRKDLRKQLDIKNEHIIGHVGRFSLPKNQAFIVYTFKEYLKIDKTAKLLLIGDGTDKHTIIELVNKLNINNSVIFTGNVNNVYEYYSAMDLFLLPSFFEGMPISLIEAQCCGLPCIISNTLTKEVKLTDLIYDLPIENSYHLWVDKINTLLNMDIDRISYKNIIKEKGYDIINLTYFISEFLEKESSHA